MDTPRKTPNVYNVNTGLTDNEKWTRWINRVMGHYHYHRIHKLVTKKFKIKKEK